MSTRPPLDEETSDESSPKSSDTDDYIHPLLAQYFDAAGNVTVRRGRLEDLETERITDLLQRDVLRDQEVDLPTTDQELEAGYSERRRVLQIELANAENHAEHLRTQCRDAGLDAEKEKWRQVQRSTGSHPMARVTDSLQARFEKLRSTRSEKHKPMPSENPLRAHQQQSRSQDSIVTYNLQHGSKDSITDSELHRAYGVVARKKLAGRPERLAAADSSFRVQARPNEFFVVGKVFLIQWSEPPEASKGSITEVTMHYSSTHNSFARVQRLVVVRQSEGYCSAVPIVTNNGYGVAEVGEKKSDYAVIYTGKQPPAIPQNELPRRGEAPMRPAAIRVIPDERGDKLDQMSRIHLYKVYTVEHTVQVMPFGMVSRDSVRDLLYQFRDVWASGHGRSFSSPTTSPPLPSTASGPSLILTHTSDSSAPPSYPTQQYTDMRDGRRRKISNIDEALASDIRAEIAQISRQGFSREQVMEAMQAEAVRQKRAVDRSGNDYRSGNRIRSQQSSQTQRRSSHQARKPSYDLEEATFPDFRHQEYTNSPFWK